jgi:hypothetical protein
MSAKIAAKALIIGLLATIMGGEFATQAFAGPFAVTTCGDAPGLVNNSWVPHVTDEATMSAIDRCGESGTYGGLAVLEDLGPGPLADPGDEAFWILSAPAGTRIQEFRASRWGHKVPDNSWRPQLRVDSAIVETCNFAVGFDECSFGTPMRTPRSFAGVDALSLRAGGTCVPENGAPACDRGASLHRLEFVLYGATVTIEDLQPPALAGSGAIPVADGAWHNATSATVSLPAATDNTGIRERLAWVGDEVVKVWTAPGAAQNGCGELNSGIAYTFVTPCAGARGLNAAMANETVPLSAVPDGVHTLRLSAVDTGGLEALTAGVEIKLDRSAPAAPLCDTGSTAWLNTSSATVACPPETGSSSRAPITSMEIELCSGTEDPCTVTATPPGTPQTVSLPEGTTSVRARQIDAAGNVGAWSAARTWRRDRTAPTVSLASPSGIVDHGTRLAASATATDELAGATALLWYSVDGGAWLPYEGPVTAQGRHSYRFRATGSDSAGNVAVEQVSLPITVRPAPEPPAQSPSFPTTIEAPTDASVSPSTEPDVEVALPPSYAPSITTRPFANAPTPKPILARAKPGLRITSAAFRRGMLSVTGVLNARATGRIRISVAARAGTDTVRRSKVVTVRRGRFKTTIRFSGNVRAATVRARYDGDAQFRAQSASKRV